MNDMNNKSYELYNTTPLTSKFIFYHFQSGLNFVDSVLTIYLYPLIEVLFYSI